MGGLLICTFLQEFCIRENVNQFEKKGKGPEKDGIKKKNIEEASFLSHANLPWDLQALFADVTARRPTASRDTSYQNH